MKTFVKKFIYEKFSRILKKKNLLYMCSHVLKLMEKLK